MHPVSGLSLILRIFNVLTVSCADVKSFMHAKTIPNAVTVATGKISHTGTSSFLPELEFMKSILPQDQWKVRVVVMSTGQY